MPDYFLTQDYPTGLDDHFTVAWWEQRGSGLSYSPDIPPESVNPDQLVSDTLSVTNYLRERFGQQKIFLMGHSGGTFIGIQAAARAPELYRAYVGVAQMSNQLESEKLAYDYMLQRFKDDGNTKMVRTLEQAADESDDSGLVGEDPEDAGQAFDLLIQSFEGSGGPALASVRPRFGGVGWDQQGRTSAQSCS